MTRDDDERAEEIVAAWLESRRPGEAPPLDEWVRAHPEIEGELRAAAKGIESLGVLGATPATSARQERIGEYRILREIGRGGMGVVYEAEQPAMRRRVALKVLYPSITNTAKAVERFQREARAGGALKHTNIVTVHQMGEDRGTWFCAMELVHGHSLDRVLEDIRRVRPGDRRRGARSTTGSSGAADTWRATTGERNYFERVAGMFAEIAEALHVAHEQGIVHRDVKPANLMVSDDGRLKILDFGLARVREDAVDLTVTGGVVGTPSYMSPEQARAAPTDARTDVWSLGATLYEVLTLRPPFHAKDMADILQKLRTEEPKAPSRADRRIPRDLETIVLKALEKEPERRYTSAAAMARDLRSFASGHGIDARRAGVLVRGWRVLRRNRVRAALAVALLASAAAGVVLWRGHVAEQGRLRLEQYRDLVRQYNRVGGIASDQVLGFAPLRIERRRAESLLREAVRLCPDRWEPYEMLALSVESAAEANRLLSDAVERGMPERLAHGVRASRLVGAGRVDDARRELDAAEAFPDDAEGECAVTEGGVLCRLGEWREAVARLSHGIARQTVTAGRAYGLASLYLRASAYEALGDFAAAIEDLNRVRDGGSASEPFLDVRIASLWMRLGHADAAQAALARAQAASRADPTPSSWRRYLAACRQSGCVAWGHEGAESAVRTHPRDAVVLHYACQSAGRRGEFQPAVALARRGVEVSPEDPGAMFDLASMLSLAGEFDEALATARRGLALESDARYEPGFRALEAECLWHLGRRDDAISTAGELAKAFPSHSFVQYIHALLLTFAARREEALAPAERAELLEPNAVWYSELRLSLLLMLGRGEELARAVKQVVARFPGNAVAQIVTARAQITDGRCEAALAISDSLLASDLHPVDRAETLVTRALALLNLQRPGDALEAAEKACNLTPEHDFAQRIRCSALERIGRLGDALSVAEERVRRWPQSAFWRGRLAACLLAMGRFEEARREAEHALAMRAQALEPSAFVHMGVAPERPLDEGSAHWVLGCVLAQAGQASQAIEHFDRAIAIGPVRDENHYNRAHALTQLGKLEAALQDYDAVLARSPTAKKARYLRACTLVNLRRESEAVAEADIALSARPRAARWHYVRGSALLGMGRLREASVSLMESVSSADPEAVWPVGTDELPDGFLPMRPALQSLGLAMIGAGEIEAGVAAVRRALSNPTETATSLNQLAWRLVTDADPSRRDAAGAVRLATKATDFVPGEGTLWNTLGVAHCAAGEWTQAVTALRKSMDLRGGGDANDWYFMAVATHRLGDAAKAKEWFDRAVAWTKANASGDAELRRFQAESAAVLGVPDPGSGGDSGR